MIAEIGINHNGSIEECKKLIMLSKVAGCDYAKIQKRNPDVCVPESQKSVMRKTPWGEMTYLEYKYRLEFNEEQIKELCEYSKEIGIEFFASVWDKDSVDIMAKYSDIGKIGSASITDLELCRYAREKFKTIIISTGMSTEEEITLAVEASQPDVLMHTNSTYPCPVEDLNLRYMEYLNAMHGNRRDIGYSGHESGVIPTIVSIPLGVNWIERHVTMDKTMWGSDQKSSINISEMFELCKRLRDLEMSYIYKKAPRMLFDNGPYGNVVLGGSNAYYSPASGVPTGFPSNNTVVHP